MTAVIEAFGRARLLSFDRDPATRDPTVEVAHEALLREWVRLRTWVDRARDDLRTQRRLGAAAGDWVEAGRDPSFLAAGSRLERFAALAARADVALLPMSAASWTHRWPTANAAPPRIRLGRRANECSSGAPGGGCAPWWPCSPPPRSSPAA